MPEQAATRRTPTRDHVARFLCNLILRIIATRSYRDGMSKAVRISLTVVDLHTTIECVLADHADELDGERADPNLAELAHVYRLLTGWDVNEPARD